MVTFAGETSLHPDGVPGMWGLSSAISLGPAGAQMTATGLEGLDFQSRPCSLPLLRKVRLPSRALLVPRAHLYLPCLSGTCLPLLFFHHPRSWPLCRLVLNKDEAIGTGILGGLS